MTLRIRALEPTPGDIELGAALVYEYVVATAEETGIDVDVILGIIPDVKADGFADRYLDGGAYLVADDEGDIVGGVGIAPLDERTCEMNRLWIRAPFRRGGHARTLCEASLDAARELGFRRMALDVVPERTGAIALYESLGFTAAPATHEYPFPMVFLARDL
jgi:ribosomal protein S18 acetylase RimI-like enzyme